jgi:hypothetical protein
MQWVTAKHRDGYDFSYRSKVDGQSDTRLQIVVDGDADEASHVFIMQRSVVIMLPKPTRTCAQVQRFFAGFLSDTNCDK